MLTSQGKRVTSALILIPLFVILILKGTIFHFFLLSAVAALLGIWEFFSLKSDSISLNLKVFGYIWTFLVVYAAYVGEFSYITGVIISGVILSLLIRLGKNGEVKNVFEEIGFLYTGVLYVVLLSSFLVLIRGIENGRFWLLLLFVIIWANDTAAYYTGMRFGKRKLCPEISPKKSVEGLLGGFAGGIVASLLFTLIFFDEVAFIESVMIAVILGIIGPLGDLCESMLKRSSGVKDSGGLIPGHGGILDRIDSVLFSAPFIYYFAVMR